MKLLYALNKKFSEKNVKQNYVFMSHSNYNNWRINFNIAV